MTLALEVAATVAARGLDLQLAVPAGRVVALVGPNGAGKSSLVSLVSGRLRPTAGTVRIDGELVAGPRRWLPPHRRRVAVLDQRALLLPHLDIRDNVAFGPRARGVRAAEARAVADRELAAVGCAELAAHRPVELSGGQAQRVALARALAADPRLVLLDEPMAALDVSVAPAIRALLRERLRGEGRTALLVTHDVLDALSLADWLAVVEAGRVVQEGPVAELFERPRSAFLADLVGVNLLAGVAVAPDAVDLGGTPGTAIRGLSPEGVPLVVGAGALATFPPAAVAVHLADPGGSPRNHLGGLVAALEPRGPLVRLACDLPDGRRVAADLTAAAAVELDLRPGVAVRLVVKAAQVTLYPR